MRDRQWVVLGNPEHRRVRFFQEALAHFGQTPARVCAWLDVAREPARFAASLTPGTLLRIDSPGENFAVDKLFLTFGAYEPDEDGTAARLTPRAIARLEEDRGRILLPRQWFLGWRLALKQLDAELQTVQGVVVTPAPADILLLCDKRRCYQHCVTHGLAVPRALPSVRSFAELTAALTATGLRRVFIKLAHGSSASGVVALETNGRRFQAYTSVELVRTAAGVVLYNSLKIRQYRQLQDIRDLIDGLGREGVQVEQWIPKAGWQGQRGDLRVVTIGGRVAQTVFRLSASPMTNLHLGNRRGDVAALQAHLGAARWNDITTLCEQAAASLPGCLHLGLDVLLTPNFRRCVLAEMNAFGDLLPNVFDQGWNTYQAQVWHCLQAGVRPRPTPAA